MELNNRSIKELGLSSDKIHYIESILNTPIVKDNILTTTIDAVTAERWYGNFYGLLNNELLISPNALYIHLRINGFNNNVDFKATTDIKLLDPDAFDEIEETYLRNEAYRKSLG